MRIIKTKIQLQFLLIVSLLSLKISAQDSEHSSLFPNGLKFYHYDTSNGLSNNMVSSITEDKIGFIWIGTNSGLNRFDGNEFEKFDKENSGLLNNYIQQIVPARNGDLYLATNRGIHTYDIQKNLFQKTSIENSNLSDGITRMLLPAPLP